MSALIWPVLALLIGGALCRLLLGLAPRLPHDAPNTRSLHATPVPRVGGLAVWGAFVPLALLSTGLPGGWRGWAGGALLLAVSMMDDWRGVTPRLRFTVHLAAALVAASAIIDPVSSGWPVTIMVAIAIAWGANAYNFMDGSDGLAAAMAITGFTAYALAAGPLAHGLVYVILVASVVPFAIFNVPPARMFMGDCGAVPLGYLAVMLGVGEAMAGTWPLWFPALVFLPFAADATVTLGRRLWRRERVWQAHREHYYQRWHQLGAGHRGTLIAYAILMVATAGSALLAWWLAPAWGWPLLVAWCVVLGLLYARIDYHWRRREASRA